MSGTINLTGISFGKMNRAIFELVFSHGLAERRAELQVYRGTAKAELPAYRPPSCSFIRRSWLYFAVLDDPASDPILICLLFSPTARSASVASSVSPDRAEIIVRNPAVLANAIALTVSVNVPI